MATKKANTPAASISPERLRLACEATYQVEELLRALQLGVNDSDETGGSPFLVQGIFVRLATLNSALLAIVGEDAIEDADLQLMVRGVATEVANA